MSIKNPLVLGIPPELFKPWEPDPRIEDEADDVELERTDPYVVMTLGVDPKYLDDPINPDDNPNIERDNEEETD